VKDDESGESVEEVAKKSVPATELEKS